MEMKKHGLNLKLMKVCNDENIYLSRYEKLECIDMNEEMPEHVETERSILVTDDTIRTTSTMEQLVISTTSTLALPPPPSTIPRDLWTNKVEFLLSVIGYVVDLGKENFE
jgi:hypothetical protein